ncbi:hypothetical protein NP945_31020 [Mesorhizobium sp. LMG17149]|jgi:hypothetical protein|uniref:hypothetical protein n=1 Tax=Mesorhizobium sp. LMG17149 TaxID=2968497 RepID=UPI00211889A2|nr:hypothetical protein [Mesorhizobium sp. LMG17149]MCQ8876279.1 hypothetical protein [Mesorhizobium sp. LMG17149]
MDEDAALELFIMAAHQRQRHAVAEADIMLSNITQTRRIIAESRKLQQRVVENTGAIRLDR